MLAGNIASFIIGGVIATVTSFLVWHTSFLPHVFTVLNKHSQWPADFDWSITRRINTSKPFHTASSSSDDIQNTTENKDDEKDPDIAVKPASIIDVSTRSTQDEDLDPVALRKAFVFASISSLTLVSSEHALPKRFTNNLQIQLNASSLCLYSSFPFLCSSLKQCIRRKATRLG